MNLEGLAHSLGLGREKGVSERATVSLADLTERRAFQNEKSGARVRIMSLDPLTLIDYSISDTTKQQLLFGSLEELQEELQKRGLQPEAIEEAPDQAEVLGAAGAQVIDIAAKRAARNVEVPGIDEEKLKADKDTLNEKLLGVRESINAELIKVAESLNQTDAGDDQEIAQIQTSILEFTDRADSLMRDDEAADTAQGSAGVTAEFLAAKNARLQNLEAAMTEVKTFAQEVSEALQVAEQGSIDDTTSLEASADTGGRKRGDARKARRAAQQGKGKPADDGNDTDTRSDLGGAALAHGGNLDALLEAKKMARPASIVDSVPVGSVPVPPETTPPKFDTKDPERPKVPGGPKGPEGPEDFGKILERLQSEVMSLIEALKTPGAYVAFRNGMTPEDRGGKRHFFGLKDIKSQAKTDELDTEQLKQVYAVEAHLEKAAQKKFFQIKNATLKDASRRWRAELNGAVDEATLDALETTWSGEEAVPIEWREVYVSLNSVDQGIVTTDFTSRFGEFKSELREKRQQLKLEGELLPLLNIVDPVKGREKIAFLESVIIGQYGEYIQDMQREAKKIKSNATVSPQDCWALWQQHGGEARLEEAITKHLRVFHEVDSEVGKEVFRLLMNSVKQETNQGT